MSISMDKIEYIMVQKDHKRRYQTAHSPVKCEILKNTRPRHLKFFRTQYIFVTNYFW